MFGYGPFIGVPWLALASAMVFWGAVIAGVVLLVRYVSRGGRQAGDRGQQAWHAQPGPPPYPGGMHTPEQILAERFARGEIDEQEFRQRVGTLRGVASYPGPPPQGPPPHAPPQQPPATP